MKSLLLTAALIVACAIPAAAAGRRVIYVDNSRSGGTGYYGSPLGSIGDAQRMSKDFDVIFVAETGTPYEENVALKRGQMIVGSAFGLDAVRSELHIDVDAPSMPAARGTGPLIHGTIVLSGDNVVAGCTLIADKKTGVALNVQAQLGPVRLHTLYVRTSQEAYGLYVDNNAFPVTWTGGRLDASDRGAGILINGGNGNVTFDHVAIGGEFGTGIAIRWRSGGAVVFRNGSAVKISDASREAVTVTDSRGAVTFDAPLQVKTSGGRGLLVNRVSRFTVSGGASWIDTTNGTAVDIRESALDVVFDHVSAAGVAPGRLTDGIILDKVRGRFEVAGGPEAASVSVIRNALSYGVRVTQSTGVRMHGLNIVGGGTVVSTEECPQDVTGQTNLRCRAGLYLRHVEKSAFEAVDITDNAGVGLNANNLTDVTFADVHVKSTGDQSSEAALLIDEARGAISFARCSFVDGGGGAVVIEQQFNTAGVTFDACEIAAPERPMAAPSLFRVRAAGGGKLTVTVTNSRLHDNAGGAITVEAKDNSSMALIVHDSRFALLGESAIAVSAANAASVCLDASANALLGNGTPAVLVSLQSPQARVHVVAPESLAQRNGGATVALPDATSVTAACH